MNDFIGLPFPLPPPWPKGVHAATDLPWNLKRARTPVIHPHDTLCSEQPRPPNPKWVAPIPIWHPSMLNEWLYLKPEPFPILYDLWGVHHPLAEWGARAPWAGEFCIWPHTHYSHLNYHPTQFGHPLGSIKSRALLFKSIFQMILGPISPSSQILLPQNIQRILFPNITLLKILFPALSHKTSLSKPHYRTFKING